MIAEEPHTYRRWPSVVTIIIGMLLQLALIIFFGYNLI